MVFILIVFSSIIYLFQEVQLGEELLATGDIPNGVEHLALAVAVCGQPHSLLSVLQQTLPPQIYHLLLQNLEVINKNYRDMSVSQQAYLYKFRKVH